MSSWVSRSRWLTQTPLSGSGRSRDDISRECIDNCIYLEPILGQLVMPVNRPNTAGGEGAGEEGGSNHASVYDLPYIEPFVRRRSSSILCSTPFLLMSLRSRRLIYNVPSVGGAKRKPFLKSSG